ncbi:MAG: hypothetical protein KJ042_13260 [Deltaproteobacteria bacterium]|nr:hypothetical protein [Deltaproteobacteria bacterium]
MNATLLRLMVIAQEHMAGTPAPGPEAAATPVPTPLSPPMPTPHAAPGLPAPPAPTPTGTPGGPELQDQAVGFVAKIDAFFKYDFFPNLWMYLTFVFLCVIAVLIFIAINIGVRFILDPILQKVFRFDESSKVPSVIGGIASIVAAVLVFQWFYHAFPALQPPVQFVMRHFQ